MRAAAPTGPATPTDRTSPLTTEHRTLYAEHLAGTRALMSTIAKQTSDPLSVARAVEHALTARRPRRRYLIDASSKAQVAFTRMAPTALTDAVLAKATTARVTPTAENGLWNDAPARRS